MTTHLLHENSFKMMGNVQWGSRESRQKYIQRNSGHRLVCGADVSTHGDDDDEHEDFPVPA